MNWATALREDLQQRARAFADRRELPYYLSRGQPPTVLFERPPDGSRHGNFHPDAWAAILANSAWTQRVEKRHSQPQALPPEKAAGARELDSCNSSDALLMNCFCPAGAAQHILAAFGYVGCDEAPEFGFKPGLQLLPEGADTTEIDMRVGAHLFESKLTEADFTERPRAVVLRYRSLERVFDVDALPWTGNTLAAYQLVRNVLAADEHGASFTLLCDQRRPDLLHAWWAVHAAIRSVDLRRRCGFRTWQEVAAVSPKPLADFLAAKCGVCGPSALWRNMREKRVALDSNALTYLLDAVCDGYLPEVDPEPLGPERVAMFQLFCYMKELPWVGPTVRAEYGVIVDAAKRDFHDRWTRCHLEDCDLATDPGLVASRASDLENYHCDFNDCRVVAEAEAARVDVLLSVDRKMLSALGSHARVALMRPTEFLQSLALPPGSEPRWIPTEGSPLAAQTWWRL